jgi:hypothetical protein
MLNSRAVLPDLARAHEAAGNSDSAVRAYERYVATPWEYRFEPDAVELGWTMRRLGELYQRRDEPAKARDAHAWLARLWRRADPELQPVLAEVRVQ